VDAAPNTNICPVCCGYPGVLPVFNAEALSLGVRAGLALHCRVNSRICFERKNYFYPDLPKNYQISQYKQPLAEGGKLQLASGKAIGITRVHLEEDAGKLIHKNGYSLVDLNRVGTPLMEIVSEPDISSPQEAYDYLTRLKLILQYAGISDCDMEKGTLRCDANISLKKPEAAALGVKAEIKNLNSFKGVRDALAHEEKRQAQALDSGEKIIQETRLWDVQADRTVVMRSKEEAHDYRYFPEPDLPDFLVTNELIEREKGNLGEDPFARQARFVRDYRVSEKDAVILVADKWLADFFEKSCEHFDQPDKICGWVLGPFLEQVNDLGRDKIKLSARDLARIAELFVTGKLNNLMAKKVLNQVCLTGEDAQKIVEREGLAQVSGEDALAGLIADTIKQNPAGVKDVLSGNDKAIMFLVGQVMKKSGGKANPKVAREMLEKAIRP
jgi:aspartyl-tRNA(Asn)/glutamyl-tRNA(Gln) amidotransferase subunit B